MAWKEKKVGEIRKRYFDWGEFFGTIFAIGFVILLLIGFAVG